MPLDRAASCSRTRSSRAASETRRAISLCVGFEFWFLGGDFFVRAVGVNVITKTAGASLIDNQFPAGKLQRDSAFVFRAVGFENRRVTVDPCDAAALTFIRHRTLRAFVFVDAGEFDLQTLLSERPDFEFVIFRFPGAIHLRGAYVAAERRMTDQQKERRRDGEHFHFGAISRSRMLISWVSVLWTGQFSAAFLYFARWSSFKVPRCSRT